MKCNSCNKETFIRKGIRGIKQRYKCKACGKYQQDIYTYKRYDPREDNQIRLLNAEGGGVRSMSRILGYSKRTIIRRILYLAHKVVKPVYLEYDQVYEVDEMWTLVGKKHPSHFSWITHAMNRRTNRIIDVAFGLRSKKKLEQVIDSVKAQNPKKIITDKLNTYPNLVQPYDHDTRRYSNNHIERGNLTLRTHLKRLFRKTICFSRSQKMLEACVLLYFYFHNWKLKME